MSIKLNYKDVKLDKATINGYVVNGKFWGDNERFAKMDACTHIDCEKCGKEILKACRICDECFVKSDIDKWEKSEKREISHSDLGYYSKLLDKFYYELHEIEDDCEYESLGINDLNDLLLYHIERESPPEVDLSDIYENVMPDDFSTEDMATDEIIEACKKLNELIASHPLNSFYPTKIGVKF